MRKALLGGAAVGFEGAVQNEANSERRNMRITLPGGARTRACRVATLGDAWRAAVPLAIALILPLHAQERTQTPPTALRERPPILQLSLKRAVEIALAPEGNARVQIAEELIRQAESRAGEARSALLPNFDGSLNYSNRTVNLKALGFQLQGVAGLLVPTLIGPFDVLDFRLSGQQSVFDFSTIRRYQAARTGITATKAETRGTKNQVADQVARAYLAAIRADASLATAKANLELSEALVKLANSQKAAGTGTGIEVVRAETQRANDRQGLLAAGNERDRTHLQLMKVLGLKLEGAVELTDGLSFKAVDAPAPEQALKVAQTSRAELDAQREHESTARLNYSATKWERLPSVGFFGDYGTIGNGTEQLIPTRTYGLTLKVPIFDGARRDARRAESLSQLRVEQIRTRDLKEQIELDIRVALDALESAAAQVSAAKEGIELADRELQQARRRYEAGVATSIEVTDAQARVQRARENQINALFNYNLARIDLNTAMGTIDDLVNNF
jgi:outer membrane protein TolC